MGRLQASLLALGMAAAAYAVARLSLGPVEQSGGIAALWPLSGLTVGVLARADRRAWPWILAAVALGAGAANLRAGTGAAAAAGFATANVLEGLLAAVLVQRIVGRAPRLAELRGAAVLLLGGAGLAAGSLRRSALSSPATSSVLR